jgi:glycyl-tRNA synthetase beta chain
MSDFLFEIFSEEIPAAMQKNAAENLTKIAGEILAKNNLKFESAQIASYVTPNRLVLYIHHLQATQKLPEVKRVGPRIDADPKAIEGFLKSVGVSSKDELQKVENGANTCYAHFQAAREISSAEIIKNSLPQIVQKITATWPKLMRFDVEGKSAQATWIRPVRNIACMFGSEVIDVEFFGLRSNNLTFGHPASCAQSLEITNAAHYEEVLEDNFVILRQEQRKQKILQQIREIIHELRLDLVDDEKSSLLDEVTGLCQFPTALVGTIDEKFLQLPEEVLVLTLKLNQRYFCLRDLDGNLAPKFIFISNALMSEESRKKIIKDNEKLVRARLSDAEFFIAEDLKHPLISRRGELDKISFHQKLGSLGDKIYRLENLAKFLSVFVPHCDLNLIERASALCKVDLTTKAVYEFPELQGKIGSFYAYKQHEDAKIIAAIYEHYLPLGASSDLPKTPLGIALSIADKIDAIVGFFAANEKPTSSKDPYALRRAALGIIRIAFHYNIAVPIRVLVEKSFNAFSPKLLKILLKDSEKDFVLAKKELVEEVVRFFVERLKVYLRENENLRADIVNAVIEEYVSDLDSHRYCDILYLAKKIKFLDSFLLDAANANLISLYKRSANILAIEEKKDGKKYLGKPSILGFKVSYEKVLYRRIKQISKEFNKLVIKGEFEKSFKLLHVLEAPLQQFFDNVMVNEKDKNLRENRLMLLAKIRALFGKVADLSKIEIV